MADILTQAAAQQGVPKHLVDLGNGTFAEKSVSHGDAFSLLPGDAELAVSAVVAAAANNQTLPAAAAKTTYITGFTITGGGATAASVITVTVTGPANTLSFAIPIPAGVTLGIQPLVVAFPRPVPAAAVNTAIVVNVPSFGAGNTNAAAAVTGFQR